VWRTSTRLHQALAGKQVVESDLRWPDLATADLTGRTTVEVVPRGKHILHRLSGGLTLHSHLRMEGQWRIEATATLKPGWRHVHELRALVAALDWTALGLRLGMLDLVETAREHEVVGHLGPDLLDPTWDDERATVATANLARADVAVGAALLDQQNLAGLGTIWVSETLFAERVWPWASAAGLGEQRLRGIVDRGHLLLVRAIEPKAALSVTGEPREAWVYGRARRSCRRCGTTVRVAPIGTPPRQRNLYFCPRCQGAP
jgi:endonuclease-8